MFITGSTIICQHRINGIESAVVYTRMRHADHWYVKILKSKGKWELEESRLLKEGLEELRQAEG